MTISHARAPRPRRRRRRVTSLTATALAFGATVAAVAPRTAGAQMLGAPVLQNAFANRGLTAAADFGSGGGARSYGLAAAWAPASGRIVLSAGAGVFDPNAAGAKSRTTYGVRAAFAVKELMSGAVGVGAFAGFGGAAAPKNDATGVGSITTLPVGVTLGYRRAIGATRAISVYGAPFYSWARTRALGQTASAGRFRVSFGLDAALIPKVGLTLGVETGAKAAADEPGARASLFGAGLSYAFR
jgi:hypothetical protein